MRQELDAHISVTRNGKLTAFGERMMKMSNKEKEKLRNELYRRDGKRCHYCGIEEGNVIQIWEKFYGLEKRGKRLELDRKNNQKGYYIENCVLACAVCNCAKSNKFAYEEFLKVGAVIKEIWQQREKTLS